jgi:hypothetical protein
MVTQARVRFFGWVCLVGGVLQIADGILLVLLFGGHTGKDAPIDDLLLLVVNLCLMGGPLGLLARRAFGSGGTRILGTTGVGITLLGQLCYVVGMSILLLYPSQAYNQANPLINITPAGALLSTLGMLLAGIATLRGKQLRGWQAFAPLAIPLAFVLNVVSQTVFFSVTGPHANPLVAIIVLCFGPMWVLVGYAIQASASTQSVATFTPGRVPSSTY